LNQYQSIEAQMMTDKKFLDAHLSLYTSKEYRMKLFRFFTLLLLLSGAAMAQDKPQAYIGAQIITISGQPIANGVLVIHRGKIVAVGANGSTQIPADAERHEVSGKVIMPGLIDSHSHIGGGSGADGSAPLQPDVRVMDSINARDVGFKLAQACVI
jgi:imidazolonepropionase-like amidohydrolase